MSIVWTRDELLQIIHDEQALVPPEATLEEQHKEAALLVMKAGARLGMIPYLDEGKALMLVIQLIGTVIKTVQLEAVMKQAEKVEVEGAPV